MKRLLFTALAVAIALFPTTLLMQPGTPQRVQKELIKPKDVNPMIASARAETAPTPPEPIKPQQTVYTVISGDSLTKIGSEHNVEWQRLWAKNTQLTDPDVLSIGEPITIPFPNEVLARELPAKVSLPEATPGVVALQSFDANNTYSTGNCTWYAKSRRGASIPNGLGSANSWYARAKALGMAVGTEPRVGAIGATSVGPQGHVVYVESLNKDGTITISEMNYKGFNIISSRTTSALEFTYIY